MGVSRILDAEIWKNINDTARKLEDKFEAQVIFYFGSIDDVYLTDFRNFIEKVSSAKKPHNRLAFFIQTGGGRVQACEKMVEIIRHHYEEVYFVIPDLAMSAGTILCMSGDKIYMDYSSSLGPIDPQVPTEKGQWVPALGHLDKVNELIEKSNNDTISPAEFALLQNQNLALLRLYEQARDLSVQLLKDWLVKYKFKTWTNHKSDNREVTNGEKQDRALKVAEILGNNKIWHSHGRMIGINTLRDILHLEIDDYTNQDELRELIRRYADLLSDYISRMGMGTTFHFYLHHHTLP